MTGDKIIFEASSKSGSRNVWMDPQDVDSITLLDTRYGTRLICTMRDSGAVVWLLDTIHNRTNLGIAS